MRKYFDLLLDLLEIEDKASYEKLAQQIEDAPAEAKILFAHRARFILSWYLDLLKWELAPEEFVLLGDVESSIPLWQEGQVSSEKLVQSLLNGEIPVEDVIILDQMTWQVMLGQEQRDQLHKKLKQAGKTLILG